MKKKKILKLMALITATALTLGVLWFANGFLGNPVSKALATKSAETYLAHTYGDTDFALGEVNYNFKTGGYYAIISSPSSIDSYFSLDIDLFGTVVRDLYENNVLDGYNTMYRCEMGYRDLVDSVFSAPDFPYVSELDFGMFLLSGESEEKLRKSLQLDQEFDYELIGKEYGELTFYAQDEEITLEKASEILLGLKEVFDWEQVYFHQINFTLEKPYIDGHRNFEGETLYIYSFLYEDIYEEGMLERVTKANEEAKAYAEEEDKKIASLLPENIDT